MKKIIFAIGLLTVASGLVFAGKDRAERVKERSATRTSIRADLEKKFEKARTLDAIASAQQESRVLTRDALASAWAQREKDRLARDTIRGRYAHTYVVPTWSTATDRFYGAHSASVDYAFSYVTSGFDSTGAIVDSSVVRFGKEPLLQDIIVASKLAIAADTTTTGVGYEFLQDLSKTRIPVQASIETHECAFAYTLGIAKNTFQFGVRVPLRQQFRSLHIVPELSKAERDSIRETLDDGTTRNNLFRDLYGISVVAMMVDIIEQKNMAYREKLSHASMGDVSFFTTLNLYPWRLDRWTISAEIIVPGQKTIDNNYFYPLLPSSNGCLSGRLSTGFVGKKTVLGVPHMMVSCQTYFPTSINCRVPRMVTATSVTSLPSTEVFGQEVTFASPINVFTPETTIADFAAQTTEAWIRPGFALDLRVGSVVTPFISPLMQLDLFYHFHMRGSDELRQGLSPSSWYTNALVSDPYRVQHNVGFSFVYEPNPHVLVRTGIETVITGRSMPIEIVARFAIGGSW